MICMKLLTTPTKEKKKLTNKKDSVTVPIEHTDEVYKFLVKALELAESGDLPAKNLTIIENFVSVIGEANQYASLILETK